LFQPHWISPELDPFAIVPAPDAKAIAQYLSAPVTAGLTVVKVALTFAVPTCAQKHVNASVAGNSSVYQ
jgi:hypothetical protein